MNGSFSLSIDGGAGGARITTLGGDAIGALLQLDPSNIVDVSAYRCQARAAAAGSLQGDNSDPPAWWCAQMQLLKMT